MIWLSKLSCLIVFIVICTKNFWKAFIWSNFIKCEMNTKISKLICCHDDVATMMLPLSTFVIKKLELLINWLDIFLFTIICFSILLRIKEERAKPFRIEIDLFLVHAYVRTGSLLMLDSIFFMNSIIIFFSYWFPVKKSCHPITVDTVH